MSSSESEETHIVVVGDFMVDRTWLLAGDATETSQAHGDVVPKKRLHPTWKALRPGGAGMHVMALQALHRVFKNEEFSKRLEGDLKSLIAGIPCEIKVHALGLWGQAGAGDGSLVTDLPHLLGRFNKIDGREVSPTVEAHLITAKDKNGDDVDFVTTLKTRFYSEGPGDRPTLSFRFDQDPPKPHEDTTYELPDSDTLPAGDQVASVFVSDFDKGAVNEKVLTAVHNWTAVGGTACPWFIDSKNAKILEILPKGAHIAALAGNRDEVFRLASNLEEGNEDQLVEIPRGRQPSIELLKVIEALSVKLSDETLLAVKLDEEGACLHQSGKGHLAKPNVPIKSEGIAAGDFFDAALQLLSLSRGFTPGNEAHRRLALQLSCACAAGWLDFFDEYWKVEKGKSFAGEQESDIVLPAWLDSSRGHGAILAQAGWEPLDCPVASIRELEDRHEYQSIRRTEPLRIDLTDGMGLAGEFVSTDPRIRRDIRRFANRIKSYLEGTGKTRPLNCLLVASPGSGKSFLAGEIAKGVGCQKLEVNCAQVASAEELLLSIGELEAIAAKRRSPLLFLDEVDTHPSYYPLLLAPLWDAEVSIGGKTRSWDDRTVSILVASQQDTPERYLERLIEPASPSEDPDGRPVVNKGPDLASRINGPLLNLKESPEGTAPSTKARTSRVYLTISLLSRYYEHSHRVEAGLLDLVYCAPESNPRAIEQFVATLKLPTNGAVTLDRSRSGLIRIEELATKLGFDVTNGVIHVEEATSALFSGLDDESYPKSDCIKISALDRDMIEFVRENDR